MPRSTERKSLNSNAHVAELLSTPLKTRNPSTLTTTPKTELLTPATPKVRAENKEPIIIQFSPKRGFKANITPKPTIKKKPRKKNLDPSWKNPQKKKSRKGNILAMRTHSSQYIKVKDQYVMKKTTVLLKKTPLKLNPHITPNTFAEKFNSRAMKNIQSYRPAQIVSSDQKKVLTPGQTELTLAYENTFYKIYTNTEKDPIEKKLDFDLEESEETKAQVKPNKYDSRPLIINITSESQKFVDKEIKKSKFKRSISQKQVLGMSAEDYVKSLITRSNSDANTQTSNDVKADGTIVKNSTTAVEGLHNLAYQILGKYAQKAWNIGVGTYHANTNMLEAEYQLKPLLERYPNFTLRVDPEYFPNTRVLKTIKYLLSTADFELPFEFDGQNKIKPDIENTQYVSQVVGTIADILNEKKQGSTKTQTTNTSSSSNQHTLFIGSKHKLDKNENVQDVQRPAKKHRS